jgi:NDP-sugar pyrophosphorylase family protein
MIVVVPMAGRGSRYSEQGYEMPKPLITVAGKPMINWALKSLEGVVYDRIVFVALSEHETRYGIRKMLTETLGDNFELILIEEVTEGQLCTVLKAKEYFEPNQDLLIIASDSLIKSEIGKELALKNPETKGIISVINLPGERWSFAKTNSIGEVIEVAEKIRISNHASTGIYYFAESLEFLKIAENMIANREKTKGEYYVIPVYQKMIQNGVKVRVSIATEMWDMGTPEAKLIFEDFIKTKKW